MIETQRLLLRNYTKDDFQDYWEYVSQPNVGPRCGWPPYTDKNEAIKRLELESGKPLQFAIVYKAENKVVGSIEIMEIKSSDGFDLDTTKEIGMLLNEDYWGKGIMTEAMKAIVKYCFDELNQQTVIAGYYEPNTGSGKVQQKCGFKEYGLIENYTTWYLTGEKCSRINTKITKNDCLKMEEYKNMEIKYKKEF